MSTLTVLNLISVSTSTWYPHHHHHCSHPVPPAHEDILAAVSCPLLRPLLAPALSLFPSYLLYVNVRSRLSQLGSPALLPPPFIQLGRLSSFLTAFCLFSSSCQLICFSFSPQFGSRQSAATVAAAAAPSSSAVTLRSFAITVICTFAVHRHVPVCSLTVYLFNTSAQSDSTS